jgi:chromosome segregation ATPase
MTTEAQKKLDEKVARFEERMEAEEEELRRPFTKIGTVQEARKVIQAQLDAATKHLKTGSFHMAAQEQAQRETVQDLTWLMEDLQKLVNILVSDPNISPE